MIASDHIWVLALALAVDAIIGDPQWLWRRMPHPVVLVGSLIDQLDRRLNRDADLATRRKMLGIVAILVIIVIAAFVGWAIESLFSLLPYGWLVSVVVVAIMLAGRSLYDHVAAVAEAFDTAGLNAARGAIAKIVGRDPEALDESGLSRAAIETTAENFSDGLVAPALWFALLGLPGLLAYKAINTADSMIGHRSDRFVDFGWASARLDDLANWLPARLSAFLIGLAAPIAGGSATSAIACAWREASKHRSPNAGWPEAAMAGALGVALLGPRLYEGALADDPFINPGGRPASPADIGGALRIYVAACALLGLAVLLLVVALGR